MSDGPAYSGPTGHCAQGIIASDRCRHERQVRRATRSRRILVPQASPVADSAVAGLQDGSSHQGAADQLGRACSSYVRDVGYLCPSAGACRHIKGLVGQRGPRFPVNMACQRLTESCFYAVGTFRFSPVKRQCALMDTEGRVAFAYVSPRHWFGGPAAPRAATTCSSEGLRYPAPIHQMETQSGTSTSQPRSHIQRAGARY